MDHGRAAAEKNFKRSPLSRAGAARRCIVTWNEFLFVLLECVLTSLGSGDEPFRKSFYNLVRNTLAFRTLLYR